MKKRFLAIALSLVMAAGCVACGGGTDNASEGGSGSAEGTEGAAGTSEGGSGTVVVAMGAGFSTLDPGYVYEKYPPLIVNACYENLF